MLPDKDTGCHRTGFQLTCRHCVVEHHCQLWQRIDGVNKNTGEPMHVWGCSDRFTNNLLVENSSQQRQTAAAVESFRNEMLRVNGVLNVKAAIASGHDKPKLIEGQ